MGSSDGGGGGGQYMMSQVGPPMPGLPIAGSPEANIDPTNYGKYQSFLPEPLAEGTNPMATGLRPDMLKFRTPKEIAAGGAGATAGGAAGGDSASTGGDVADQIQQLRTELAKLQAGGGGGSRLATTDGGANYFEMGGGGGNPAAAAASGGGGGTGFAPAGPSPGLNPLGGIDNPSGGAAPAGYRTQLPPSMMGLPAWQGSGPAGGAPNGGTNLPTDWRAKDAAAAATKG